MRTRLISAVAAVAITTLACGGAIAIQPPAEPPTPEAVKQLWTDPGSEPRDLFWGVGGQKYAPKPDAVYAFKERDPAGFSTKYTVKDPDGIEWSAKIGPEAQVEVVLSRILWGLGFHQQPIYYMPSWTMNESGTITARSWSLVESYARTSKVVRPSGMSSASAKPSARLMEA